MEKFTPYEKLSKKKKRELDAGRRTVWAISPVTRRPENPKVYNRKKAQKWEADSVSVLSLSDPIEAQAATGYNRVERQRGTPQGGFYESSLYPAG